ncbi:hypothetical protein PUN28_005890 [Cardiocondyla obscurior]|uniref:Uncharacterized protein n=1 Tax=Cardiocondyla obscurior TaxID=286306 RepID=A0AAW2G695_9HYME
MYANLIDSIALNDFIVLSSDHTCAAYKRNFEKKRCTECSITLISYNEFTYISLLHCYSVKYYYRKKFIYSEFYYYHIKPR